MGDSKKKNIFKRLKKTQEKPKTNKKLLKLAEKLAETYSEKELAVILKSGTAFNSIGKKIPNVTFDGEKIKFGVLSDTHIGSIYFKEKWLKQAFEIFDDEKCSFITHSGDLTEGFSNRPGHVYEMTHIGVDQQKTYAIKQLSIWKKPIYIIDGNHDRWYMKSSGTIIVKDIADALPNVTFLGHDEGLVSLNHNVNINLWHGEDGSSYAISYRVQKIVEAFTGGEKPNMLIAGHVHKQGYFMERHIHCLIAGACSMQSKWMRSTRKANHAGFHVVELHINKLGISRCKVEWFPFYG